MYCNVDTLRNKIDELQVNKDKYDVLILTEVLSKNNTLNKEDQLHELKINDFNMYNNSNLRRGVSIYVRDNLICKQINIDSCLTDSAECCFLEINKNGTKFLIGGLYRNQNIKHL